MLNSFEVGDALVELGLQPKLNKKGRHNVRIRRYQTINNKIVYVKTSNDPDNTPAKTNPLVIDPELVGSKKQIDKIDGVKVNWDKSFHNSNIGKFSEELNGKTPIGYGFDVKVDSVLALEKLLNIIDETVDKSSVSNPLDDIEKQSHSLPSEKTTRKAVVDARVGQGPFREDLFTLWGERCAVLEITTSAMLRASHIKPWKDSDNKQRLDKYNGLLLSASLDLAFDAGLISFKDTGEIIISPLFADAHMCAIYPDMKLKNVFQENKPYLAYHRQHVFKA